MVVNVEVCVSELGGDDGRDKIGARRKKTDKDSDDGVNGKGRGRVGKGKARYTAKQAAATSTACAVRRGRAVWGFRRSDTREEPLTVGPRASWNDGNGRPLCSVQAVR